MGEGCIRRCEYLLRISFTALFLRQSLSRCRAFSDSLALIQFENDLFRFILARLYRLYVRRLRTSPIYPFMLDSKERKFISSSSSIPTPMFFFLFYLFSFYFHFSSPSTVITFLVVRSVTSFSPLDDPSILSILIDPSVSFFLSFFSSFPSSSFYISSFSSFSSSSFFPIFLISRCFPRAR